MVLNAAAWTVTRETRDVGAGAKESTRTLQEVRSERDDETRVSRSSDRVARCADGDDHDFCIVHDDDKGATCCKCGEILAMRYGYE